MKKNILLLGIVSIVFFTNCSKEQTQNIEANSNLNYTLPTPIKEQRPQANFDLSEKGLYHGVIASGINLTRGKIWINIGNDNQYNAYVELIGGDKISYQLAPEAGSAKTNTFSFIGERGAFTINLNDIDDPLISNNTLDNEEVFAKVVKGTNGRMPFSFTGLFNDDPLTGFSGTWNMVSTGVPHPILGETISTVMATWNSNMYTDNVMESYDNGCLGLNTLPLMGDPIDFGGFPLLFTHFQNSTFHGNVDWSISFSQGGGYLDEFCQPMQSGTFAWTHQSNGTMVSGTINFDGI